MGSLQELLLSSLDVFDVFLSTLQFKCFKSHYKRTQTLFSIDNFKYRVVKRNLQVVRFRDF